MATESTATQDGGIRAALARLGARLLTTDDGPWCRGAGLPLSTAATMDGYGWCPYGGPRGHKAQVKDARGGRYRVLKEHQA